MKDAEKEKDRFKEIPDSLIRSITEIMSGYIKSERIAYDEYNNILNRNDVKNLFYLKKPDINQSTIRKFFDELEFIIFGSYNNY